MSGSFQTKLAPSSRVTKSYSKNPLGKRSPASPLTNKGKTSRSAKPSPSPARSKQQAAEDDDLEEELFSSRLDDHGLVAALAADLSLRDVPQMMLYAQDHMFDAIPEAGGFNSTRIAEILNFRRRLPPIVTVAHVYALSKSPTAADREISELVRRGALRRITIPGRGVGRSAIGASLVLTDKWVAYVEGLSSVDEGVRRKYIKALRERPGCASVPWNYFSNSESTTLIHAGLLTATSTSSADHSSSFGPDRSTTGTLASLSTAGSRAAAGSLEAVGGRGAFHDAGGGGGNALGRPPPSAVEYGPEMNLTLPSVGPYLRLLEAARNYLVALLSRSAFREAPRDLLQERYDGNIAKTEKQKSLGFQGGVLPARTKRWKQLYGLKFQWVLEECLGTGLVEVFETGSVGLGVRLT